MIKSRRIKLDNILSCVAAYSLAITLWGASAFADPPHATTAKNGDKFANEAVQPRSHSHSNKDKAGARDCHCGGDHHPAHDHTKGDSHDGQCNKGQCSQDQCKHCKGTHHRFGHGDCGKKGCRAHHGAKVQHPDFLKNEIGLSTKQTKTFLRLKKTYSDQRDILKQRIHEARDRIHKLIGSKTSTEAEYKSALESLRKAHNVLRELREKKHEDMRKLLTAKQRAILMVHHAGDHHR